MCRGYVHNRFEHQTNRTRESLEEQLKTLLVWLFVYVLTNLEISTNIWKAKSSWILAIGNSLSVKLLVAIVLGSSIKA